MKRVFLILFLACLSHATWGQADLQCPVDVDWFKLHDTITIHRAVKLPTGTVWYFLRGGGALRQMGPQTPQMSLTAVGVDEHLEVYDVFSDNSSREWLLTRSGIRMYQPDKVEVAQRIQTTRDRLFFSGCAVDKDCFFGSSKGCMWHYEPVFQKFTKVQFTCDKDVRALYPLDNESVLIDFDGLYATYDLSTRVALYYSSEYFDEAEVAQFTAQYEETIAKYDSVRYMAVSDSTLLQLCHAVEWENSRKAQSAVVAPPVYNRILLGVLIVALALCGLAFVLNRKRR